MEAFIDFVGLFLACGAAAFVALCAAIGFTVVVAALFAGTLFLLA